MNSAGEAQRVIDDFRTSKALEPLFGSVEALEVVRVSQRGAVGAAAEVGIRLVWVQDGQRYELVMPVSRLVDQSGGIGSAAFFLRLAVDEPHGPTPDGTVLLFEDLPSGPYDGDDHDRSPSEPQRPRQRRSGLIRTWVRRRI